MYSLYYYPNNASLAPHFVLQHIGAAFELVLVDRKSEAQKSADYLKLNPAGRIPTLTHGDTVLFESPAICLYLAEQHPTFGLAPVVGHQDRPRFLQWLMFLTNTLQADYMAYCYPEKHTTMLESVPAVKTAHADRVAGIFDILDRELEDREHLAGASITICDYFLMMLCIWSSDMPTPPQSLPHLGSYLKRMAHSHIVRTVCEREGTNLSAFL